jgi:sugar O-acyltransferase (sialic acid O-acetyltransferase NeuD family)
MPTLPGFVIIGAGGLGQEIAWAAKNLNKLQPSFEILGFCDDDPQKWGVILYGCPVLGRIEAVREAHGSLAFLCGVGNNLVRRQLVARALQMDWKPVSVIDPSVIVAQTATIGDGTYVGAASVVSPNARLGSHIIINHGCSIGHDSNLGDFVQVSPGGRISGGCTLHEGAFVGSNGVVAPGRSVGKDATLGAASFAVTDVPDHATSIGVPARVVSRKPSTQSR